MHEHPPRSGHIMLCGSEALGTTTAEVETVPAAVASAAVGTPALEVTPPAVVPATTPGAGQG